MEQIHYIYKITFLKGKLSGHYYIGKKTADVRKKKLEWSGFSDPIELAKNDVMFDNYTGSGTVPRDYFKKYRKEFGITFNKEIIHFSKTFEENALVEESIIGDNYKTDPKCVNLVKGGMCGDPSKMSHEERKVKYSRVLTEEGRKRLSKIHKERCSKVPMPWKGKKRTDEEKKKISEAIKEYFKTHKSSNIGRKMSDESKKKLSESLKKFYTDNPDKRPLGRKNSEESKKKNSEKHKDLWNDDEYRKKTINAMKEYYKTHDSKSKGKKMSEETKKRLSEYFKGRPNPKNKGKNNGMYGKTPSNAKKVIQLSIDDVFIKEWESITKAAMALNLATGNIAKVCNGERKKCGGFHWKYKKEKINENDYTN